MVFSPLVMAVLVGAGIGLAPGMRSVIARFLARERAVHRSPVRDPSLFVVVVVAGMVFTAVSVVPGDLVDRIALGWVGAAGIVLGYVDMATHRLPHGVTLPALAGLLGVFAVGSVAGAYPGALVRAVLAGLVGSGMYLAVVVINPVWLGFGDAILAGLLSVTLGWRSWLTLTLGGVLVVWVTGLHALALLTLRKARRGDELPAAPGMLVGALLALLIT